MDLHNVVTDGHFDHISLTSALGMRGQLHALPLSAGATACTGIPIAGLHRWRIEKPLAPAWNQTPVPVSGSYTGEMQ